MPLSMGEHLKIKVVDFVCSSCGSLIRTKDKGSRRRQKDKICSFNEWQYQNVGSFSNLALRLISHLLKSTTSKIETVFKKLRADPLTIKELIDSLYDAGYLLLEEKKVSATRWEISTLSIPDSVLDELLEIVGSKKIIDELIKQIKELVGLPAQEDLENIHHLFCDQLNQLEKNGRAFITSKEGKVIASTSKIEKYKLLLKALFEIYQETSAGRRIPFRTLSIRLAAQSKKLNNYKEEITTILDSDMRSLGIYPHAVGCWVSGEFHFKVNGYSGHGRAGYPAIFVSVESFPSMTITSSDVNKILIIENQTVFEEVLRRGLYSRKDCAVLFSEGFMSTPQEKMIRYLIASGASEVYMWNDLDPHGILIYLSAIKRLNRYIKPVFMTKNLFTAVPDGYSRELKKEDISVLKALSCEEPSLKALQEVIMSTGIKIEQEILLDYLSDDNILYFDCLNTPE